MSDFDLKQFRQAIRNTNLRPSQVRFDRFYPFWKMEDGQEAIVRFLPDEDQSNPLGFVVENLTHKVRTDGRSKTLPCLEMYGQDCPLCTLSREYFASGQTKLGKTYYRRREFLASVLVISSPFPVDDPNLIRLVSLGPKLFETVQNQIETREFEQAPFDMEKGHNFHICKQMTDQTVTYQDSHFAAESSPITPDLLPSLNPLNLSHQRTPLISNQSINRYLPYVKDRQGHGHFTPHMEMEHRSFNPKTNRTILKLPE